MGTLSNDGFRKVELIPVIWVKTLTFEVSFQLLLSRFSLVGHNNGQQLFPLEE